MPIQIYKCTHTHTSCHTLWRHTYMQANIHLIIRTHTYTPCTTVHINAYVQQHAYIQAHTNAYTYKFAYIELHIFSLFLPRSLASSLELSSSRAHVEHMHSDSQSISITVSCSLFLLLSLSHSLTMFLPTSLPRTLSFLHAHTLSFSFLLIYLSLFSICPSISSSRCLFFLLAPSISPCRAVSVPLSSSLVLFLSLSFSLSLFHLYFPPLPPICVVLSLSLVHMQRNLYTLSCTF